MFYKKLLYTGLAAILGLIALPASAVFAADDTQGPITSAVGTNPAAPAVGDLVTVIANVDDTATGGSNIASAELSINGGGWTAMSAVDAAFDSVAEDVAGTFTVEAVGPLDVCVRGTDAAGNVGAETCLNLAVETQYVFTGFQRPIRDGDNFAKAGRTIPVKWILKLADGTPVSDPAAFAGIMSYEVDCDSLVGDPATAVMEQGPGSAAVRATMNGMWRALWQTPKAYADSCRIMFVAFSDGSTSPEVLFRFR
jgi:hypothetical protein